MYQCVMELKESKLKPKSSKTPVNVLIDLLRRRGAPYGVCRKRL